jgi:hypothetical protein
VRENPLRGAEVRVYDILDRQLPAAFTVFYSSPWIGTTPDGREIDGEADFVVAHPDLGLLVIEVKGGAVLRDGTTGQWRTRDGYGITHRIKNPVEQARGGKYQLLKKLRDSDLWRPRFIRGRHGVILPDSERPSWDLGADMPLSIFAFEDDTPHLGEWVRHRLSSEEEEGEKQEQPLGRDGVSALEKLLARSFILRTPLRNVLAQEDQRILVLTEEQFQILDGLEDHTRYAIAGGAGTGKTILAVEKATRLARAGQRTLLTCYNRPLAEYLRRACTGMDHLVVTSFHEFCGTMASRAGIHIEEQDDESSQVRSGDFYRTILPEALMRAIEQLPGERFDAIVVDEGQDFAPEWWIPLELCLKDVDAGVLYIFYDDNQRVTDGAARFPDSLPQAPFRLTRNLRNTKPIFDTSLPFYGGGTARSSGPEGRPVQWIECGQGDFIRDTLVRLLGGLTKTEGIPAEEIAVLAGSKATLGVLESGGVLGRYPVSSADDPPKNTIVLDTVRRFKGLERSVVVLIHPGEMLNDPELLYVAITRARLHLMVVGRRPELDAIREYGNRGGPAVGA